MAFFLGLIGVAFLLLTAFFLFGALKLVIDRDKDWKTALLMAGGFFVVAATLLIVAGNIGEADTAREKVVDAAQEAKAKAEQDKKDAEAKAEQDKKDAEESQREDIAEKAAAEKMGLSVEAWRQAGTDADIGHRECVDEIIKSAKYGAKQDGSFHDFAWSISDKTITIYGHDMLITNAFNAEGKANYTCQYTPGFGAAITSLD